MLMSGIILPGDCGIEQMRNWGKEMQDETRKREMAEITAP
jgi:hypothetical protein